MSVWGQKNANSSWGKAGAGTGAASAWGKASNSGNNQNNNANKQGQNANNKPTSQWGSNTNKTGTTGNTGWGSSKTGTTATNSAFQTNTKKEPVVTPVCTVDLPIPNPVEKVDLALTRQGEGIPPRAIFAVNHISQMEFFNTYTIDEIRYYDYLSSGFIDRFKAQDANKTIGFFGQKTNQTNTGFNKANTNQEIIQKNITPWKRKPEEIKEPPLPTQEQPFGALPATTINAPQTEGDDSLPKQPQISDDLGFRDNISLYQHLIKTSSPETATPGLRQLKPQKIQTKTPKTTFLISKPSIIHEFTENFENEEKTTDRSNYSYIPDLSSIHEDDEVYNFTVIEHNFGSIMFPDGFKAKQINPEQSISISDRKVDIDFSKVNVDKKKLGIDKNFVSIVTLKNVFPSESRSQESLREYETDLIKFCSDHNYGFISYEYNNGILMFSVPSISLYPIVIE